MNSNSLQKKIKNIVQSFSIAGSNVYGDWGIILGLFCIVALMLVGLSAGLFFSIHANENTAGQTTATTATTNATANDSQGSSNQVLDIADLTNLVSLFQSKDAQMSVFTVTYPGPSDPAVPMKRLGSISAASSTSLIKVTKPKAK
jgi:hypothetical protein